MDSRPLPYNIVKSIIGHMDIFRRCELAEFPSLKIAERKSDLYLNFLALDEKIFVIDDDIYTVVRLNEGFPEWDRNEGYRCHRRGDYVRLPWRKERAEILKIVSDYYLAGRGTVKLTCLSISVPIENGNLPKGLKFDCKELVFSHPTSNTQLINSLVPFLIDRPLETVRVYVNINDDPIFEHDLIRKALYLSIHAECFSILPVLLKLRNPNIYLFHFPFYDQFIDLRITFVSMVDSWLKRCPPIGTQFSLKCDRNGVVDEMMSALRDQYLTVNGEVRDSEGVASIPCLTIQMDSGDELNIYAISTRYPRSYGNTDLRMEVMQRGTSRNIPI